MLVLLLILLLTACQSKGMTMQNAEMARALSEQTRQRTAFPLLPYTQQGLAERREEKAPADLIDWMTGGTFSCEFEILSEEESVAVPTYGSLAADEGRLSLILETEQQGMRVKSRIIVREGCTYVIDDVNKVLVVLEGTATDMTEGWPASFSGGIHVGSGEGKIGDRTLPYEEYSMSDAAVRYYLEAGQVYGIESSRGQYKTTVLIQNPQNVVSEGVFDLPLGYYKV